MEFEQGALDSLHAAREALNLAVTNYEDARNVGPLSLDDGCLFAANNLLDTVVAEVRAFHDIANTDRPIKLDPKRLLAALRRVEADRGPHRRRLLEIAYGPAGKRCRAEALQLLLGRKPSPSETQWTNWRRLLLDAVGATGKHVAAQDADFEERAALLLNPPLADSLHEEGI